MASSDVDQRFLSIAAHQTARDNPLASAAFLKILGNSVLLARKLYRARKLRKLDTSRDTKSLSLYQHIIWMSREGLDILEAYIVPFVQQGHFTPETRVLSVKLRASYHHIFCLFHNHPPVSQTANPSYQTSTSRSPRGSNGQTKRHSNGSKSNGSPPTARARKIDRGPIDSITSETSFVTNPYAASTTSVNAKRSPPGATPAMPPGLAPVRVPQPSAFLLPIMNWLPITSSYFVSASAYAETCLPGSHPLRLSVALEHSAFLWDCLHDHEGARGMARKAIKDVYRAPESMEDEEFQAAAELVAILGRMMKRRSWEGTPKPGNRDPGLSPAEDAPDVPPVPPIDPALHSPTTPQTRRRSTSDPDRSSGGKNDSSGGTTTSSKGSQSGHSRKRSAVSKTKPSPQQPQHVTFSTPPPASPRARRPSTSSKQSPSSTQNRRSNAATRKAATSEAAVRAGVVTSGAPTVGHIPITLGEPERRERDRDRRSHSSGRDPPAQAVQGSPRSSRRAADSPGRGGTYALGRGGGSVMR